MPPMRPRFYKPETWSEKFFIQRFISQYCQTTSAAKVSMAKRRPWFLRIPSPILGSMFALSILLILVQGSMAEIQDVATDEGPVRQKHIDAVTYKNGLLFTKKADVLISPMSRKQLISYRHSVHRMEELSNQIVK